MQFVTEQIVFTTFDDERNVFYGDLSRSDLQVRPSITSIIPAGTYRIVDGEFYRLVDGVNLDAYD